jgi:hypothetical protein
MAVPPRLPRYSETRTCTTLLKVWWWALRGRGSAARRAAYSVRVQGGSRPAGCRVAPASPRSAAPGTGGRTGAFPASRYAESRVAGRGSRVAANPRSGRQRSAAGPVSASIRARAPFGRVLSAEIARFWPPRTDIRLPSVDRPGSSATSNRTPALSFPATEAYSTGRLRMNRARPSANQRRLSVSSMAVTSCGMIGSSRSLTSATPCWSAPACSPLVKPAASGSPPLALSGIPRPPSGGVVAHRAPDSDAGSGPGQPSDAPPGTLWSAPQRRSAGSAAGQG